MTRSLPAPLRTTARNAGTTLGAVGIALAARRAWRSPTVWVARMTGTSISAPDAAGWVTDFLNAAYFARQPELREVEDLRVALAILTTRWQRLGHRRLHAPDVAAFHRAFGRERFLDGRQTPRGSLDREQLLEGAQRLLGPWFAEAYADDERRAHGIAFETRERRDAYRPEQRLRHAKLGDPTPPERPAREQVWHTYDAVEVASAPAVLTRDGQPDELDAYVADLNDRMVRLGRDQPPVVPHGATASMAIAVTTHEGHFMGRGVNRLVLYELGGTQFLRAAGTWDDMPLTLEGAYRSAGRQAQEAFWGSGREDSSMLVQIALLAGGAS